MKNMTMISSSVEAISTASAPGRISPSFSTVHHRNITYNRSTKLFFLLLLGCLYGIEETEASKAKVTRAEKRALKDMNTWFGIQILGFIVVCLFIPPIFMFFYELYQDPATPVLRKLLWLRLKELIGYNPYTRYTSAVSSSSSKIGNLKKNKKIDPVGRAIVDELLSDIVIRREKGLLKVNFPSSNSSTGSSIIDPSGNGTSNNSNSTVSSSSLHTHLLDRSEALLRKRSATTSSTTTTSTSNASILGGTNLPT